MGNLLRLLSRDDCFSPQKYDVYLDFENAEPTESELETYNEARKVLDKAQDVLRELASYSGAGLVIREAINNSAEEYQSKAWKVVIPLVRNLRRFYEFSIEIEEIVPKILTELCSVDQTPSQHLETQQALVKQFSEILEFVLKFDEVKMTTPAVQNDFSFYRRTVNKNRTPDHPDVDPDSDISSELANRMSLFYANATPMLNVLSASTEHFVKTNKDIPIENTIETLATMTKVCRRMLDSPDLMSRFKREETHLFVLRVMVGLIILYDHVSPNGAFIKPGNVDIKGCIKVIKEQPTRNSEGLLNALRYTTKHLNDENTPRQIKSLLSL